MAGFSVDTKLFRELGALLVGRESTALIELIKNAYDADATEVTIFGSDLASEEAGKIIVADNGIGMSEEEFARGFLTIAGRSRSTANRRSPWFERRYTGEKGIGRLAAHKLAHALRVTSRRWNGRDRDPVEGFPADSEVRARIDWDAIEAVETLADIEGSDAVRFRSTTGTTGAAGTQLTLAPLRKRWTDADRNRFFEEIATLTPPTDLTGPLPQTVISRPLLLEQLSLRDELRSGEFTINFRGELGASDADLLALAQSASWIIEVDCDHTSRRLRIAVAPTRRTRTEYASAENFIVDRVLPSETPIVGFQARILQRQYESWPARYRGIRVYYEGFRVLPYGERRDDWLDLDRDYRSRAAGELGRLKGLTSWNLPPGHEDETLYIQGNSAFFGAVLLTRSGADELQMLVNREGFLPSTQFDFVADTVRRAIDLQVRLRYAATVEVKRARKLTAGRQARATQGAPSGQSPTAFRLRDLQGKAIETIQAARAAVASGRPAVAQEQLGEVEEALRSAVDLSQEAASEATMLRVVASLGLEHAAFVHEVRSLALSAQTLVETLERLAGNTSDRRVASRLRAIAADARELRERLRRNAVYLADVTGVEGRRRRARQNLRERVERVVGFFVKAIERRGVTVELAVPPDIETPPLFPAELAAIISNLLSNAIKFAEPHGRIRVAAQSDEESVRLRVENSGESVDLRTAERWFEPFRSSTTDIDESLGQGMGLGLTITRSLLDEYGGQIRFVAPSPGFATAIEAELPQR